ncbi:AAA family ATPase [Haloechinothrix sp. LS1_15]|uniref:bifunctional aminoglycoside phosphotransferase/ATP-binding protein n=1 Tax=Haloechinothrix sp. LS1_15 TaxID=2652248 RepID=UPI00294754F8|nr:AAA family ATPase [Haloechinothrix sp. LS1_15]MDV6014231.1 AAA family ATPase [Haloechinothrix sp. LS1_15]
MSTASEATSWASVRETHAGIVFLVGDRAYKVKKPVDLGFLDFTDPAERDRACRSEVELNRRLAPDVYLGTAEVVGPGTERETIVVMRRMPDDRRLATLIEQGADVTATVRQLAELMATFHARAERGPLIDAEGTGDALRRRWYSSIDQVRPFQGAVLDHRIFAAIEGHVTTFLAGRTALFDHRVAEGKIVDGHGDLLAADIFALDDGPRVLDCLDFDDRLRWLDVLDDLAFLAMDLERLGAPQLAAELLRGYRRATDDESCAALRHHYIAYRAFVRCKVACLRHAQGDATAADRARADAELTLRNLERAEVRLILVGGLPGTGKSTLAGALAESLGARVISSDHTRKELAGITGEHGAPAAFEEGIYTPSRTDATYREMLRRAGTLLSVGESVILDASWHAHAHRELARELASRAHARLIQLRCEAPAEVMAERLRIRRSSISDATPAIAARMTEHTDPWPDAYIIDTVADPLRAAAAALDRCGPGPRAL